MYAIEHPMSLVTPPTADENYNAATLPSATPEIANKGIYTDSYRGGGGDGGLRTSIIKGGFK